MCPGLGHLGHLRCGVRARGQNVLLALKKKIKASIPPWSPWQGPVSPSVSSVSVLLGPQQRSRGGGVWEATGVLGIILVSGCPSEGLKKWSLWGQGPQVLVLFPGCGSDSLQWLEQTNISLLISPKWWCHQPTNPPTKEPQNHPATLVSMENLECRKPGSHPPALFQCGSELRLEILHSSWLGCRLLAHGSHFNHWGSREHGGRVVNGDQPWESLRKVCWGMGVGDRSWWWDWLGRREEYPRSTL